MEGSDVDDTHPGSSTKRFATSLRDEHAAITITKAEGRFQFDEQGGSPRLGGRLLTKVVWRADWHSLKRPRGPRFCSSTSSQGRGSRQLAVGRSRLLDIDRQKRFARKRAPTKSTIRR